MLSNNLPPLAHCLFPQNTVLKTWQGKQENVEAAQKALLTRAKANSDAQKGVYDPGGCSVWGCRGGSPDHFRKILPVLGNSFALLDSSQVAGFRASILTIVHSPHIPAHILLLCTQPPRAPPRPPSPCTRRATATKRPSQLPSPCWLRL